MASPAPNSSADSLFRISEQSLDAILSPYLTASPSTSPTPLRETQIRQISSALRSLGKEAWSKVPRIYAVLFMVQNVPVIDSFIHEGISDLWFPFSHKTLPNSLRSPSARFEFLRLQTLVLTKAFDLEREDGKHRHFSSSTDIPLQKVEELGKGGFGFVDRVVSTITYREYARKLIPRGKTFKKNADVLRSYEQELANLKKLSHLHIVEFVGSYTDSRFVGILMAPVADCNLQDFLLQESLPQASRSFLRTFYGCLAAALCYLHENKIRHKDIKPQNVLVKGHHVFLTDFGTSLDWSDLGQSTTTGITIRTPRYCAPEVANYLPRNSAADLWSLGCVFLEIWTVLKGEKVPNIYSYLSQQGSMSSCYFLNLNTALEWGADLYSQRATVNENPPFIWVQEILKIDRDERWTAKMLCDAITEANDDQDQRYAFSGTCCMDLDDSTDSTGSSKRSSRLLDETGVSSIQVYEPKSPRMEQPIRPRSSNDSQSTSLTLRPAVQAGLQPSQDTDKSSKERHTTSNDFFAEALPSGYIDGMPSSSVDNLDEYLVFVQKGDFDAHRLADPTSRSSKNDLATIGEDESAPQDAGINPNFEGAIEPANISMGAMKDEIKQKQSTLIHEPAIVGTDDSLSQTTPSEDKPEKKPLRMAPKAKELLQFVAEAYNVTSHEANELTKDTHATSREQYTQAAQAEQIKSREIVLGEYTKDSFESTGETPKENFMVKGGKDHLGKDILSHNEQQQTTEMNLDQNTLEEKMSEHQDNSNDNHLHSSFVPISENTQSNNEMQSVSPGSKSLPQRPWSSRDKEQDTMNTAAQNRGMPMVEYNSVETAALRETASNDDTSQHEVQSPEVTKPTKILSLNSNSDQVNETPAELEVPRNCKGCGETLEGRAAYRFADIGWHVECFACSTCATQLEYDSDIMLHSNGTFVCRECAYICKTCGIKIEDLAILTDDSAFCRTCFKCRNCKQLIDNLRYAKTSQGIFCMHCHEALMARRRKKSLRKPAEVPGTEKLLKNKQTQQAETRESLMSPPESELKQTTGEDSQMAQKPLSPSTSISQGAQRVSKLTEVEKSSDAIYAQYMEEAKKDHASQAEERQEFSDKDKSSMERKVPQNLVSESSRSFDQASQHELPPTEVKQEVSKHRKRISSLVRGLFEDRR